MTILPCLLGVILPLTGMTGYIRGLSGGLSGGLLSQKMCGVYLVHFKHPEMLLPKNGSSPLPGHLYKFGMTRHLEQRLQHLYHVFDDAGPVLHSWTHIDPIYLSVAEKEIKSNLRPFRTSILPSQKEMVILPDTTMPLIRTLYKHLACRYSSMELL